MSPAAPLPVAYPPNELDIMPGYRVASCRKDLVQSASESGLALGGSNSHITKVTTQTRKRNAQDSNGDTIGPRQQLQTEQRTRGADTESDHIVDFLRLCLWGVTEFRVLRRSTEYLAEVGEGDVRHEHADDDRGDCVCE